MQERVLVVDANNPRHQDHYKFLYSSFVVASSAAREQGESGAQVASANAKILDVLDGVSDEDHGGEAWPGLSEEYAGYTRRALRPGTHTLAFLPSQISRLEKAVDAFALNANAIVQRRFLSGPDGLIEWLKAAEKRETTPVAKSN